MTQDGTSKDIVNVAQLPMLKSPSSPLLRLPGELRNMIYGYVLGGHTFGETWENKKLPHHFLASLLVCRQIYSEARMLVFELNTLVHTHRSTYGTPENFSLTRLSLEQMSRITSVRLHLNDLSFSEAGRMILIWDKGLGLDILRGLSSHCIKVEIFVLDWCGDGRCREARLKRELSGCIDQLRARVHQFAPAADTPIVWFLDRQQHLCLNPNP